MQHVDHIKLCLLRTEVGIYRVTGMLIKTGRGITRGPIPLITWESDAAAVWCKCTRSNASALAMLPRRADTLRVNPICPQSSRYDIVPTLNASKLNPETTSFPKPKKLSLIRGVVLNAAFRSAIMSVISHARGHRTFTFEIPEK